jgi:hypothetical protein
VRYAPRAALAAATLATLATVSTLRADELIGRTSIAFDRRGSGAASCPDEKQFAAAVSRMTRADAAPTEGSLTVVVRAEPGHVDGTVTMTAAGGGVMMERKLHGKDCKDVSEGLALIVALTIDPLADPSVPALPLPTATTTPPPPPPERKRAPPIAPKSPSCCHVALLTGARVGWGLTPVDGASLLVGLEAGLQRDRWTPSVRITGGPIMHTALGAGGGTVVFAGGDFDVLACPAAFAVGSYFTVGGCLSGGATLVSTRSAGFAVLHTSSTFIGYLGVSLAFRAALAGPLGLVLEGGLRFPLQSFIWEVEGFGAVDQTSPVVGSTSVALDLRFP